MAQFYAGIHGRRGEATRLGDKKSGMRAFVNGWDVGARVVISWNEKTGEDEITIFLTSGSNGGRESSLGTFTHRDVITGG